VPQRPLRPCSAPGCPALVRAGRCVSHARQAEQARGTRHARGYDHKHVQWRAAVLARDPVCTYCHAAPSTDADHVAPLRERPDLRLDVGNGRGACKPCHAKHGTKAGMQPEGNGMETSLPTGMLPSAIPLTIVCGPPASGKTTWVLERAKSTDLIIDLDQIKQELSGQPFYHAGDEWVEPALLKRNALLAGLSRPSNHTAAWFIATAGWASHRRHWAYMLRPIEVVVLSVPLEVCIARIRADDRRAHCTDKHIALARQWWDRYTADRGRGVKLHRKPTTPWTPVFA
jgi:shikimate kinase